MEKNNKKRLLLAKHDKDPTIDKTLARKEGGLCSELVLDCLLGNGYVSLKDANQKISLGLDL